MKLRLSEKQLTGAGIREETQGAKEERVSRAFERKPVRKDGCEMVSRLNTTREAGRKKEQCRG